jgi:hypothetical protein
MPVLIWLALFALASGGIGYHLGRRTLEQHDPGWLPPERRRWRP